MRRSAPNHRFSSVPAPTAAVATSVMATSAAGFIITVAVIPTTAVTGEAAVTSVTSTTSVTALAAVAFTSAIAATAPAIAQLEDFGVFDPSSQDCS